MEIEQEISIINSKIEKYLNGEKLDSDIMLCYINKFASLFSNLKKKEIISLSNEIKKFDQNISHFICKLKAEQDYLKEEINIIDKQIRANKAYYNIG